MIFDIVQINLNFFIIFYYCLAFLNQLLKVIGTKQRLQYLLLENVYLWTGMPPCGS